jgi:hypothetical protein
MLARLYILLSFQLTVPEGEQFTVYEYEDSGYKVRFYPPGRSDRAPSNTGSDQLKIDSTPAFQADVLRIDFHKDSFDRRVEIAFDPPVPIITRAINAFLIRLRHVTRAAQVRPLNFPSVTWRLQYLNDDETELEEKEGFVRGRRTLHFSFSWIALNKKVWDDIHNLGPDYEPPPWEGLLLDASAELPSIGPTVVLAATALEVFISQLLDQLAVIKGTPPELWRWLNERSDRLREPSVEEQYDALLKFFTGHSLKEEQKLWESFKNLKSARNSFVHEGIAKIGGSVINTETAQKLIASASEVISKVKQWIPQELHWPEFKHVIQVEIMKRLT